MARRKVTPAARLKAPPAPESAIYAAGFKAGVEEAVRVISERYELTPRASAMVEAMGNLATNNRSARVRRDERLLPEVVRLIQAGEVSKTAAGKLKVGGDTIKRIRRLAVTRGLLKGRARG